ncbi:protease S8 tripeptidyl peptidase I [Daldinia vernicosa]|uniref:protease S8 tripeptidyl peptidase I n=1 Tax=Daldinia vernicosa TaxID=114800 RepID=UPI0020073628|nr:protease S8 tripeptidyl peptidase I [Daldinia vernicosa]KAI0854023.1 protease S8 tripeptidyl peptidase I [Daldinia vernicosa]
MKLFNFITLAALAALEVFAAPPFRQPLSAESSKLRRRIPDTHIQHEKRAAVQERSWTKIQRAVPDAILPMRIGLKQQNLQSGHDLLMDISNPESKNYGKHLSAEEVVNFFEPSEASIKAVEDWLIKAGIPSNTISQSSNKQWVQFDAPVNKVEDLLLADYYVWEHVDTGAKNIACDEYHLPKEVREHIDYITPGIKLMGYGNTQEAPSKKRREASVRPVYRFGQPVDEGELAKLKSERSKNDLATLKRTTGPNVEGPLRFASPVEPADVASGNFTLPGGCDQYITPDCIRALYGIPKGSKKHPDNKMGIFQSLGQHYTQHDLDTFFWSFTDEIPNGTHPELLSVDGGQGATTNLRLAGSEANLDFQMAYGLIWPQEPALYQVDDEWYQTNYEFDPESYMGFFNNLWNAIDGSYCTFEAYGESGNCKRPECRDPVYPNPHDRAGYSGQLMCGVYKPTNVISISYSGAEIDLPASYQQRQCAEIMKLGLQGSTIIISSGDDGVGGFTSPAAPTGCLGPARDVFNPQFLATCPYILTVGSTVLQSNGTPGVDSEEATDRFRSGGGFSNIYDAPDWQKDIVNKYLEETKLPFEGYEGGGGNYSNVDAGIGHFNKLGRAYPDVSANGDHFVISSGGELLSIGGTSASAPLWGSVITLINEERLAAGKSPVGFVHQVLYSHPEVFKDITKGDNRACKTTGFPAAEGWDPVSGMGTPDYPKLLELFLGLP